MIYDLPSASSGSRAGPFESIDVILLCRQPQEIPFLSAKHSVSYALQAHDKCVKGLRTTSSIGISAVSNVCALDEQGTSLLTVILCSVGLLENSKDRYKIFYFGVKIPKPHYS